MISGLRDRVQVTSLAQCIAISFAATSGLGTSLGDLAPSQIDGFLKVMIFLTSKKKPFEKGPDRTFYKAEYASTPFLLLTLALVKWSICVFINHLSPTAVNRHVDMAFRSTIGLWFVSGTAVSIFQCSIPKPWDYIDRTGCTDRVRLCPYLARHRDVLLIYKASVVDICQCIEHGH